MNYDFTSVVNRRNAGSEKWNGMLHANPAVPEGIIPFSVADMELRTPPEVVTGLKSYLDEAVLGYSSATPAYHDAVCGWMKRRHGWEVEAGWIIESNGVVPALYGAVQAFTEPGDGVLVMTPVYYPFFGAVTRSGRELFTSDLIVRDGRYVVDFDDLARKAAGERVKLLFLCSPHNPVGRVWTRDELERIGHICLEHDLIVVSDEIHFDLILPGHKHTVFSTLSEALADRTIVCTAPSKTFNLAGMQASNLFVKNPRLRKKLHHALSMMCIFSLNVLGYKACELAYSRCEGWLDEFLLLLERNRDFTAGYLARHIPEITVFPLEGTYLQWWDCRGLGMEYKRLEEFMTKEALLFLDEGYIFGEAGQGFERINLACPTHVLEEALERLRKAL